MAKKGVTYKDSGVDIDEADRLVDYLRHRNPAIGGFSGFLPIPKGYKKPLIVGSTDGVGTKLLLAKKMGKFSTLGIDLVAMVVNDLITCGARPLFFLDYYATGKLKYEEARDTVDGIIKGCEIAGCPLIGGETAELPGLYAPGDFDLAGFGVGVVDAAKVIDGSKIKVGDLVFGFASSGIHSNGYSLARRVLLKSGTAALKKTVPALGGKVLGDVLLEPTRIYTDLTNRLQKAGIRVRGMAHITGGGIPGNLNRVLPKTVDAQIQVGSWEVPAIFSLIQEKGPVDSPEMFKTFNMGLGFMIVVPEADRSLVVKAARAARVPAWEVGRIVKGRGIVRLENL